MKRLSILPAALLIIIACNVGALAQAGIGAQLKLDTLEGYSMPQIQAVVPGTTAAANLKENWFIVKVNDLPCKDKKLEDIVSMIRGANGTPVKIAIADNKKGKHVQEYTLTRAMIPGPNNSNADPIAYFNASCEAEVKQMKRKGSTIVKTFSSECGDFFFNFDAEGGVYNVRFIAMEDKGNALTGAPVVHVFDNDNEKGAIELGKPEYKDMGGNSTVQLNGSITFNKESVGVISVKLNEEIKKCRSIYIVVSK